VSEVFWGVIDVHFLSGNSSPRQKKPPLDQTEVQSPDGYQSFSIRPLPFFSQLFEVMNPPASSYTQLRETGSS